MHFPFFPTELGNRPEGLIVGFTASRCKQDLVRGGADHGCNIRTSFFKHFFGHLSVRVQAGRISPAVIKQGDHCMDRVFAHLCGGGIIRINIHVYLLYSINVPPHPAVKAAPHLAAERRCLRRGQDLYLDSVRIIWLIT